MVMKKVTVEIKETLCRQINVLVDTENPDYLTEAVQVVEQLYSDEKVVLNSSDFVTVDYTVVEVGNETN